VYEVRSFQFCRQSLFLDRDIFRIGHIMSTKFSYSYFHRTRIVTLEPTVLFLDLTGDARNFDNFAYYLNILSLILSIMFYLYRWLQTCYNILTFI
jgi:hypothetical protein